jgi:hypothetical protein
MRETASESDEEKGEEARFAVNVTAGNSQNGDADPRRQAHPESTPVRFGLRRCRRRESFEGQQVHRGKSCFATGGNAVNPRIGSSMQQGC